MANYNPFDEREIEKKRDQNWFQKVAIKGAFLVGTAVGTYGLYKAGGPARKMLEKYADVRLNNVFSREADKMGDTFDAQLNQTSQSIRSELLEGLSDAWAGPDSEIKDAWKLTNPEAHVVHNVRDMERQIVEGGELDINTYMSNNNVRRAGQKFQSHEYIYVHGKKPGEPAARTILKQVSLTGTEAEQFARLRQAVILEYLQKYGPNTEADIGEILQDEIIDAGQYLSGEEYLTGVSVEDEKYGRKIVDRVEAIHEEYMKDRKYATLYQKRLKTLHRRYLLNSYTKMSPNVAKRSKIPFLPENFKRILYGNLAETPFKRGEGIIPQADDVLTLFDSTKKVNSEMKRITSSSRGRVNKGIHLIDRPSSFDYTGNIRAIVKKLESAKENPQETGLRDFKIQMESYGSGAEEKRYLKILLEHANNKYTDPIEINIPMSTDGRVAGSSPSATSRLDRTYIVGNVFGQRQDLERYMNSTQMILHEISEALDGSMVSGIGSFKDKPEHFRNRMRSIIMRQASRLPLVGGNLNDLILMNSFADPVQQRLMLPSDSSSRTMRKRLGNFTNAVKTMKRIADHSKRKRTAVISFDLESLNNKKSGLQWVGKSAQFVKAGMTVHDYNNGNKLLRVDEISSSHGYKFYDKLDNKGAGKGFNEALNELINELVLPDGVNSMGKGLSAKQAYKKFIDQEVAAGRMEDNITGNDHFFRLVGDMLVEQIETLKSEGYDDVVIVTKNGWEFDLKALKDWNPEAFHKIKDHAVDVQTTRYARKVGMHQDISLKIEKTIVTMLGRAGISENAISSYGANMSSPQGVRKMLELVGKAQRSVGGDLFKFLTIDNKMLNELKHRGMLTRGHVSPVLDALFAAALFREDMADLMQGDALYESAEPLRKVLERRPHEQSPEDLMAVARFMERKVIPGHGVLSTGMMSQGAAADLVYSLVSPQDLYGLSGDPLNRQLNQMFSSKVRISPSKKWLAGYSTNDLRRRQELMKKFKPLITTNIHDAAADQFRMPGAEDAKNYFSHTVNMKTLYLWDAAGGEEGFFHIKDQALDQINVIKDMSVPLNDITNSDPILNDQIMNFYKKQERMAIEIAGGAGNVRQRHRIAAAKTLAAKNDHMIEFDSSVLSANKYGGENKVNAKKVLGKIVYVSEEADKNNPRSSIPKMMAKLEIAIPGRDLVDVTSAQVRSAFGKQVVQRSKTLSDGMAYGIEEGFDAVGHAQFLKKGFVGSAKNVFLHSMISDIYEVLNSDASDTVKSRYRKVLNKISKELNATVDPKNYLFRINRDTGPRKPKGDIDAFMEMAGDTNLTISKILEWKGELKGGHVWTGEEIRSLKDQGLDTESLFGHYKKALDETIDTIDKGIRSGDAAYKHLTGDQINFYKSELNAVKMMFNINANAPKMFLPVRNQDDQWTIGLQGVSPITIYGFEGRESRPFDAKFRQDYMLALKNSPHLSRSSADYIRRHTYADRYIEYQSAKQTYRAFLDTMLGKKMASGKPLNLKQIDFLVKRREQMEQSMATDRVAKGEDFATNTRGALVQAAVEKEQLLETQEALNNPVMRKQIEDDIEAITNLIGAKDANDMLETMRRSDRFYTSTEVNAFSKLAQQNNGILTFNLPGAGNDPYTLDLDKVLERVGEDVAGVKGRNIHVLGQKLKEKIKNIEEHARKYNAKYPDSEHLNPMIKFTKDGKIQLRTIDIAWDPFPQNEFNYLSGDMALATPEARIKMDLMMAVKNYQDDVRLGDPGVIQESKRALDEEWLRFFTIGLTSDVGSKFWLAGQYNPRGVWGTHYGMDRIQANAVYAKADGRLKRMFSGKYNVDSILDNLIRSDLNTIAITESMFNRFSTVLPTGETMNVARMMDKKVKKLYQPGKNVKKGYRPMPGGIMYRYPIPQAGQDGLLDVNFMVVPDDVGSYLGMDGNTFYAHTMLSGLQGWDNDGDQGVLHLKELGTIDSAKQFERETRESLQKIIDHPKIKDIIKRTQMSMDENGNIVRSLKIGPLARVIGHSGDGKTATVSITNERGVVETKMVATHLLDFTDQTKQIADMAMGLAEQTSKGVTWDSARRALSEANYAFASKSLIPFATNIVKKRAMALVSSANNVKNPRALYDFIGDLAHGLAGISQDSISIGKHGAEHAARLANASAYLTNPLGNEQFREDAFSVWKEQFKGYINPEQQSDYLEDVFKVATGELENVERLSRMSQDFRGFNNSVTDFMMGRTNASVLDFLYTMIDQEFSIPGDPNVKQANMFRELGESVMKKLRLNVDDVATFRKAGKGAAIGAAVFMGLSLFRPFDNSKSLNPADMFIDLGYNADGNPNAIRSGLELPRNIPIDTVNASFSKQAFIKLNNAGQGENRGKSTIINKLIENAVQLTPNEMYEFRSKPNITYSNYTMDINSLASSTLDRKSRMI